MADHRIQRAVAERRDQRERVAHGVQAAEGPQAAVVVGAPAGGAPVAALVGGDDVVAGVGERRHDVPPTVGELREAVEKEQGRTPPGLEAGFEHVHRQAVDVVDEARADAVREPARIVGADRLGLLGGCESALRRRGARRRRMTGQPPHHRGGSEDRADARQRLAPCDVTLYDRFTRGGFLSGHRLPPLCVRHPVVRLHPRFDCNRGRLSLAATAFALHRDSSPRSRRPISASARASGPSRRSRSSRSSALIPRNCESPFTSISSDSSSGVGA